MITEIEGSFLKDIKPYSVILHQVNCFGKIETGFITQISKKFDGYWQSYHEYCMLFQQKYDKTNNKQQLLGSWHIFKPLNYNNIIICSAFVQEYISRKKYVINYDAWQKILNKLENQIKNENKKSFKDRQWIIHAPYNMSPNLNNIDQNEIYKFINFYFAKSPVEFILHKA